MASPRNALLIFALLCVGVSVDANPIFDLFWPKTPDSIECDVDYFKCKGNIAGFADKEPASYEECAYRCREFNQDREDNLCAWFTFTHVWDTRYGGEGSYGSFRNECRFYRDCPEVERCVSPARCKSGKAICAQGLI